MRTVTTLDELQPTIPTTLTVGKFDGVHLGHQELIRRLNRRARELGGQSAALVLYPHPQEVLAPQRPVEYLTGLEERLNLMAALGLDLAIVLAFTPELAGTPARHFVEKILRHVKLAELWVGPNFALGRGREGNVPYLQRLAEELGFNVRITPMLDVDGQTISSGQIRELIRLGQVETAGRWLGRPPGLRGRVILGARRGHALGFPTANLDVWPKLMIPANGVYAVRVGLGGEVLHGVANVGVRPSFDRGPRTVEVYIFDFNRDIYGQELEVQFITRLRDEQKFDSIDALKAQIGRDVQRARDLLGDSGSPVVPAVTVEAAVATPIVEVAVESPPRQRRYEEIEHTADIAIRAYGRDLAELFINAAYGMFDLMVDVEELRPVIRRDFDLEAFDVETLLIDWLSGLLYEHEMRGEVYKHFEVHMVTPQHLKASAYGTNSVKPHRLIKAVTFHDLQIERTSDGYRAQIVFDV